MNVRISNILNILAYPRQIQVLDRSEFIKCVIWLEDRKIRELEISEREVLRNDSSQYDVEVASYLTRLGCPVAYNSQQLDETLTWLLSHAISVEYEDCADSCHNLENRMDAICEQAEMEADAEGLDAAVYNLGMLLKMERKEEEDIPTFLSRLNKFIRLFLSHGPSSSPFADTVHIQDFPLGFDTGDKLVNQMSVVLRMLHLWDFRELQTDLNSLIALGQEYTANPKTNTALGKVGR